FRDATGPGRRQSGRPRRAGNGRRRTRRPQAERLIRRRGVTTPYATRSHAPPPQCSRHTPCAVVLAPENCGNLAPALHSFPSGGRHEMERLSSEEYKATRIRSHSKSGKRHTECACYFTSEPLLLTHLVDLVEFGVGLRQVDNAFDEADDRADGAAGDNRHDD